MPAKFVLIVEDDVDIRELLQEFLEENGYDVAVVGNGREALDLLARPGYRPGLILLDRHMGQMDGKLFLDSLYENGQGGISIPVVLMSAAGAAEEKRAVAFLRKPFHFPELLEVVANAYREPAFAYTLL